MFALHFTRLIAAPNRVSAQGWGGLRRVCVCVPQSCISVPVHICAHRPLRVRTDSTLRSCFFLFFSIVYKLMQSYAHKLTQAHTEASPQLVDIPVAWPLCLLQTLLSFKTDLPSLVPLPLRAHTRRHIFYPLFYLLPCY